MDVNVVDRNGISPLLIAARNYDIESFNYLIQSGCDLNIKSTNGTTLVHYGAKSGNISKIKFLKECSNLDFTPLDNLGYSPLYYACESSTEILKLIIDYGCDVKHKTKVNSTVVHRAAILGNTRFLKFLFQNFDFDPSAVDCDGWSLLHYACLNSETDSARFLLDQGCNNTLKTINEELPSHLASRGSSLSCLKVLRDSGCEINSPDSFGRTPLHFASNVDIMNFFIDSGCEIEVKTKCGRTIVHYAAIKGNLSLLKYLKEKNADLYVADKYGSTPLHFAAMNGNLEIVKFLINCDCDFEEKDSGGGTVPHYAAISQDMDLLKFLKDEKLLNLNELDDDGKTPLYWLASKSIFYMDLEVIKFLIDSGCNVGEDEKLKCLMCVIASLQHNFPVMTYLKEIGFDLNNIDGRGNTVLNIISLTGGTIEEVEKLIAMGVDPKKNNKNGWGILKFATRGQNILLLKYFKDLGFDMKVVDKFNWSLLTHSAVHHRFNVELTNYLLDCGCDFSGRSESGQYICHALTRYGTLEALKYYKDRFGIDVTLVDYYGQSPLHFAAENGSLEKFKYLFESGCDINQETHVGRLVTHIASKSGSLPILKFIKDNMCIDWNAVDEGGWSCLHCACLQPSTDVIEFLIDCGLKIEQKTLLERSIVHVAAKEGNNILLNYFKNKLDIDMCPIDINGWTPLHCAAYKSDHTTVQLLIDSGCFAKERTHKGQLVTHFAAKQGNITLLKFFKEQLNISLNATDKFGWTTLHHASEISNPGMIQFLINSGCDVYERTTTGKLITHIAAKAGNTELLKYFKEKLGINMDLEDGYGNTPLYYSLLERELETSLYLFTVGCKYVINRRKHTTLSHVAAKNGLLSILEKIKEKLGESKITEIDNFGWSPLHHACAGAGPETIKFLIGCGCDVMLQTFQGDLVTHIAAKKGNIPALACLKKIGLDFNVMNKKGWSPIHCAASSDRETLEFLVSSGYDVHKKTFEGGLAIHIAAHSNEIDILDYLINKIHMHPDEVDQCGWTAFHVACLKSSLEAIKFLVKEGCNYLKKTNDGHLGIDIANNSRNYEIIDYLKKLMSSSF